MRLVFRGHRTVQVRRASEDEIRRTAGDRRGAFAHNGEWESRGEVLTVTFRPVILINQTLDQHTSRLVEAHERKHFQDFQSLAHEMATALQRAIQEGRDPQMETRWEWFEYDYCRASENYHRKLPNWSVGLCLAPSHTRP
jgi:hypothetical protein